MGFKKIVIFYTFFGQRAVSFISYTSDTAFQLICINTELSRLLKKVTVIRPGQHNNIFQTSNQKY